MAESNHPLNNDSLRRAIEIDSVCDDFEELLHRGEKPQIERFLERVEAAHRHSLLVELIGIEAYFRRKMGEALNEAEYMARFPGLSVNRLGETLQQEPSPNGEHNARPSSAAEQDTIDSVGERKSTQTTPFIKYFGDYELLEVIARGGMGVVYRARQTTLNRIVALKMILSAEFASSEEVERFYSEAQAAALLDHPGIVPIYEVGEYEGKHFYSMTYVEGESLASKTSTIPLSPKEAAGIVKEVAMAVEYAHQKGIIHRDIKPSNILIDIQGRPRVTDFGLAKRLTGESGLTVTGQVLGTPSYMPPEQASGRINAVGPAADVYAMGAVLYSITTGRPPFQSASSVDTLRQVVDQEPVSPRQLNPSLPIDLETIILKCLEKSVPRRYPSAQSLSDELGRFLEGKPIEARPIRRIAKAWRWCRRSPVIASLIASLILVLLSGIGVSTYFAWKERQRATSESLARNNEKKMRELAERNERNAKESEESARRALYTARINLAQSAFDDNKMSRTLRLLEDIRADVKPGGSDNRSYEWYHLWQECYRGHRFTLRGHTGAARRVAISPDGRTLAVGCNTGAIKLWDLSTGQVVGELPGQNKWMTGIAFHPAGELLISGGYDHTLRYWNLKEQSQVFSRNFDLPIATIKLSRNGKQLLIGFGKDPACSLCLWSVEERRIIKEYVRLTPKSEQMLSSIDFSQDSGLVAASWQDHVMCVWDLETEEELYRLNEGVGQALAFSPDGQSIATGDWDRIVHLRNSENGEEIDTFSGSADIITILAFTQDSRSIIAASNDGTVRQWNIASKTMTSFPHMGQILDFTISPDSKWCVSATTREVANVWNLSSEPNDDVVQPNDFQPSDVSIGDIVYAPDGSSIATSDWKGTVRVWDANTRTVKKILEQSPADAPMLFSPRKMAMSSDGTMLAHPSFNRTIKLWDLTAVEQTREFAGHESDIVCVSLSRDGRLMASGTVDGWIFVWDLGTGEVVHKIKASTHWICQLSFSQEGNYLASSAVNESCVRIWDTKTAEKVEQGDHNFHAVFASVFSPVSSAVASAAMDGSLYIFDMDSRKLLVSIQSRNGGITALAWLPDGKSIAARNVDGSITLWDTTTGVERGTIRNGRHTMLGWGMAFSPDGTLVTDCDPRGLMFWRKASDEDVLRQTSIVLPESRQSSRVQP